MSHESADFYALVFRRGERVMLLEWAPLNVHKLQREYKRDHHEKIADWADEIGESLESHAKRLPHGLSAVLINLWSSRGYEGDYDMGENLDAVVPLPDPEWRHTWDELRTKFEEGRREQRKAEDAMIDSWERAMRLEDEERARQETAPGPTQDRPHP